MSNLKKRQGLSMASALVARLKTRQNQQGKIFSGATESLANRVAGLESLSPDVLESEVQPAAAMAEGELRDVVMEAAEDVSITGDSPEEVVENAGVSAAGLEAASIVVMAANNLGKFHSASRHGAAPAHGIPVVGVNQGSVSGSAGSVGYGLGIEAFDVVAAGNHFEESVAYNLQAARQDEFGEAFFKTMVVGPDQVYFVATVERLSVFPGFQHKLDGKAVSAGKRNILDGYRDATLMVNEGTDLVPVVDGVNTSKFVATSKVPHATRLIEGNSITTGALKFGEKIDLLGISSHQGLITAGLMNQTDSIDPRVELSKIYVEVNDGTNTDVIELDANFMPNRMFLKTQIGAGNDSGLRFRTSSFIVSATTTKDYANGSMSQVFSSLAGNKLFLEAVVNGDLNLETGSTELSATVRISRLVDADGAELAIPGPLSTVTFTPLGYKLSARRTNSNRRTVGQMLDRDVFQEAYEIGLLAPISAQKPQSPAADTGSVVQQLITATHIRVSNAAVTTLLNYSEALAAFTSAVQGGALSSDIYTGNGLEGLARFFLTPYYSKVIVDLADIIANISTKDKLKDVQGFFTSLIQESAAAALQASGYLPALRSVTGNQSAKPQLVIGTDQYLPTFMLLQGDDRTAGIGFDHKVVSTPDTRMYGKIFMTFTTTGEGYQPLSFGNMLWRPELVSEIPVPRSGAMVNETMVQPAFRHIVNLPILVQIEVEGLAEVIKTRTLVNTN